MAEYRERPLLNVWTEQVCYLGFLSPLFKACYSIDMCLYNDYYLFIFFVYVGKRDF